MSGKVLPGYDYGKNGIPAVSTDAIKRVDLHYQDSSSDKFYIGILVKDPKETVSPYKAAYFYGRMGAWAAAGTPTIHDNLKDAERFFDSQMAKKKSKGYKVIGEAKKDITNKAAYSGRKVWPMGAVALTDKKRQDIIDSDEWIAEEKVDGVRLTMHIQPGKVSYFSRNASVTDPENPIEKSDALHPFTAMNFPDSHVGSILDVEAYHPNMTAAEVSGLLNAKDGRDTSFLRFKVFDMIQEGRTDLVNLEWKFRRAKLTSFFKEYGEALASVRLTTRTREGVQESIRVFGETPADFFEGNVFNLTRYTIKDKEDFHNQIIIAGGEGTMWKNINAKYKEGAKPANTWYKWKRIDTADVVVTGYTNGKGKYKGMIGAIEFGQWLNEDDLRANGLAANFTTPIQQAPDGEVYYLVTLGQCSGMSDAVRQEITANPDTYMDKVMEVEFMERTKTGAMRHPRWLRWREDKQLTDCIYNPHEMAHPIEVS